MISETYHCQSKGCSSGYGSAFETAPAGWFTERGLTPPEHCPACRAWVNAQRDEVRHCKNCGRAMQISANYKISHHKREGVFTPPNVCRSCKKNRPTLGGIEKKLPSNREQRWKSKFHDLPQLRSPRTYPLDTNPNSYYHPVKEGSRQTRKEHIEGHTEWSPFSQTKTNGGRKTPTALASQTQDLGALLRSVNIATQTQLNDRVREYYDKKYDNVVRVTLTDSARIEVSIIAPTPGTYGHQGYELITTFEMKIDQVMKRVENQWQ